MEFVEHLLEEFFWNNHSLAVENTALCDCQTLAIGEVFGCSDVCNLLMLLRPSFRDVLCDFLKFVAFCRFTLDVIELNGEHLSSFDCETSFCIQVNRYDDGVLRFGFGVRSDESGKEA